MTSPVEYLDKQNCKDLEEMEMKLEAKYQDPNIEEVSGFSDQNIQIYRGIRNEIVNILFYSAMTPLFGEGLLTMFRQARELTTGDTILPDDIREALDKDEKVIQEQIERTANEDTKTESR